MKKLITMTAYRRPDYTQHVLEALAKCDGVEDWDLHIFFDDSHNHRDTCSAVEIAAVNTQWKIKSVTGHRQKTRNGLNRNTFMALSEAFYTEHCDFIVHLEDDTVPSQDFLAYMENQALNEEPDVFTITGYNKSIGLDRSKFVMQRPWFTCWGWGTWRDRLKEMLDGWSFQNPKSFAWHINKSIRDGRKEIFPAMSRIQNIGYQDGENGRTPEWYEGNHKVPFWAGDLSTEEFEKCRFKRPTMSGKS